MPQFDHPIQFFNRYSNQMETELVYGEKFLQWAYGTTLGGLATNTLVKRAAFSKWYGWRMNRPSSRAKIMPFIERYHLDVDEFLQPPETFSTFNEFFIRKLKPEARPIDSSPNAVVFPADGRHMGFADVAQIDAVFVKGQRFDIPSLLGDTRLAARFERGSLVLSRLCPVDYHRFHFPVSGTTPETRPRQIHGQLYSVNPIALRKKLNILWANKRYLTTIETDDVGTVLFIEIGATCVGSIVHTCKPGIHAAMGDEKGYFRFGGSSVITLFEPGRVQLAEDLLEQTERGIELYAKMGDCMGQK